MTSFNKLPFVPEQSGYTYNQSDSLVTFSLEGGPSKSRADFSSSSSIVACQWLFKPEEYRYFTLFHEVMAKGGAAEFLCDLMLDSNEVEEFTCKFVPDSISMGEPNGGSISVSAQLEVLPLERELEPLAEMLILRASLNFDTPYANLSQLVNEDLGGF